MSSGDLRLAPREERRRRTPIGPQTTIKRAAKLRTTTAIRRQPQRSSQLRALKRPPRDSRRTSLVIRRLAACRCRAAGSPSIAFSKRPLGGVVAQPQRLAELHTGSADKLIDRHASAIASMATNTPGISAPKRTIDRAGFSSGKNSPYASFISL